MPDLVQRHGVHGVRAEGSPPERVRRERQGALDDPPMAVPDDVRLARALEREVVDPAYLHVCAGGGLCKRTS